MKTYETTAIAAILSLLWAGNLSAQDIHNSLSDTTTLEEAVVSALKYDRLLEETPANINMAGAQEIRRHSSQTIADVLKFKPGLNIGGDGVWATNINVRGLGENRLVTLVDGYRVETATDLTASLSMVDVNDIQRVEVVKGAQSSLYGSGAMGGIVNIITRQGYFNESKYFNAGVSSGFTGANTGFSEYLNLRAGGKQWYVRGAIGKNWAGDMNTPAGTIPNSGFNSLNLNLQAGFKPLENHILKIQFQDNDSKDVGIPGGAAFSAAATASYKNISRRLMNASYEILNLTPTLESLKLSAFNQFILRDVEMIPNAAKPAAGAMPAKVTPYATHNTTGGNLQAKFNFNENNTMIAGIEAWGRSIYSIRKKYIDQYAGGNLMAQMIRTELPLPSATFTSAGVYAEDKAKLLEGKLIMTVGARIDGNFVKNEECHSVESVENLTTGVVNDNPAGKYTTYRAGSRNDLSVSGNIGAIYKLGGQADLTFNAARSYRSPSLEELFKFIDLSGNKVHLGNVNLKSENGISADLGFRFNGTNFKAEASAFVNRIGNMIVERKINTDPASVNDTLMLDNASKALLYGADFNASYTIVKGLSAFASGSLTIGHEQGGQALPLIPPINGCIGLEYNNMSIGGASLSLFAAGAKKADSIAETESPTDGYCRVDLALNSKRFSFSGIALQIFAGIDNLTNASYTNFLSTNRSNIKFEPGRNMFVRLVLDF